MDPATLDIGRTPDGSLKPVLAAVYRRRPLRSPPLLVLGHARSGTTWIGRTLSESERVLYYNEPDNVGRRGADARHAFGYVAVDDSSPYFEAALAPAMAGLPAPGMDWGSRRDVRLRVLGDPQVVVKTVHSVLAAAWVRQRFAPRTLLVVRHPAAVAVSQVERNVAVDVGVESLLAQPRLMADHLEPYRSVIESARTPTEKAAVLYGARHRVLHDALVGADDVLCLRYEDIALDPVVGFRQVFGFARLDFTPAIERYIVANTTADTDAQYGVTKDAAYRAARWRGELDPVEVDTVRRVVAEFDLPWEWEW